MRDRSRDIARAAAPPPKPIAAGTQEQFEVVERQLGFVLPADYKNVIAMYGDGSWFDFLYLLNPFSSNSHLNLIEQAPRDDRSGRNTLSAERYIRDEAPAEYPHSIWPDPAGIFPWAITDNGGRFFWIVEGPPEFWTTVYYASRDPDFEELRLSSSEIIYGIISGDLPLFAQEFGGERPSDVAPVFVVASAAPSNST
jgi:hypothetical protein